MKQQDDLREMKLPNLQEAPQTQEENNSIASGRPKPAGFTGPKNHKLQVVLKLLDKFTCLKAACEAQTN